MLTASTSVPRRLAYCANAMAKAPQATVSAFEIATSLSYGASRPR